MKLHGVKRSVYATELIKSVKVPVMMIQRLRWKEYLLVLTKMNSTYDGWGLRNVLEKTQWETCIGRDVVHNCSLLQRQHLAASWHGPFVEQILRFD